MAGRGRLVRQDRAGPSGENGGHEEAVLREERVRDEGVDAAVDAMEATGLGALVHGRRAQPESGDLVKR